jgi:peptidoglycan/xylan/chitin deacetylase (PgdA/CDA1 family)
MKRYLLALLFFALQVSHSIAQNYIRQCENIKITKWLNGANSAFTFTFDDSNYAHQKVAEILDQYGFRGTFLASPGKLDWNKLAPMYKKMTENGHEVGSHTWNHKRLPITSKDSLSLEIVDPIDYIKEKVGVYPVSFVHPFNSTNKYIDSLVFSNYLFSRISSPYSLKDRFIKGIYSETSLEDINKWIEKTQNEQKWLIVTGHGLNGVGWSPVTSDLLNVICKLLKTFDKAIWVATLSKIAAYEYLKNEISIQTVEKKNRIEINIIGFQKQKYEKMNKMPVTIEVPLNEDFKVFVDNNDNNIDLNYNDVEKLYMLTFDLKEVNNITLRVEKK